MQYIIDTSLLKGSILIPVSVISWLLYFLKFFIVKDPRCTATAPLAAGLLAF